MKKLLLSMILITGGMQAMEIQKEKIQVSMPDNEINLNHAVKVKYRNYKGEVAIRTIVPIGQIYWGKTEYHPHEQWLIKVWDVEKQAERTYAFKDILEFDQK